MSETFRLAWRVLLVYLQAPLRKRRYRACLTQIARLERDLFPEWFPATRTPQNYTQVVRNLNAAGLLGSAAAAAAQTQYRAALGVNPEQFDLSPGAVWLVNDPYGVQAANAAAANRHRARSALS
jgi:hypothetical protein